MKSGQTKNTLLITADKKPLVSKFVVTGADSEAEIVTLIIPPVSELDPTLVDTATLVTKNDRYEFYNGTITLSCKMYREVGVAKEKVAKVTDEPPYRLTDETYEEYLTDVYPHIVTQEIKWMDNIYEGKTEVDKMLYRDDDLMFLPDSNWTDDRIENIDCLLITTDKELRSIRDLTADHLPLLEKYWDVIAATLKKRFDLEPTDVRIFFHYHPSFWRLHVHVTNFDHILGCGPERAYSLKGVMENLRIDPAYYQKVTLQIPDRRWG